MFKRLSVLLVCLILGLVFAATAFGKPAFSTIEFQNKEVIPPTAVIPPIVTPAQETSGCYKEYNGFVKTYNNCVTGCPNNPNSPIYIWSHGTLDQVATLCGNMGLSQCKNDIINNQEPGFCANLCQSSRQQMTSKKAACDQEAAQDQQQCTKLVADVQTQDKAIVAANLRILAANAQIVKAKKDIAAAKEDLKKAGAALDQDKSSQPSYGCSQNSAVINAIKTASDDVTKANAQIDSVQLQLQPIQF